MYKYRNIVVTPYEELMDTPRGLSFHKGGPIWPNWNENENRHRIGSVFTDIRPEIRISESDLEVISDDLYWCGAIVNHYGHQIVDFLSRVLSYKEILKKRGMLCFSVHPRSGITSIKEAPVFFKYMLDWFGIPYQKIRIVSKPIMAKVLYSTPQNEAHGSDQLEKSYLDLLRSNEEKIKFNTSTKPLYISRCGQKTGMIAGESYLEEYFIKNGIDVIRPEKYDLLEQLKRYKSHKNLIFAEGSAIHTLQLLGKLDNNIFILNRREGERIAYNSLISRGATVKYIDLGANIFGFNLSGNKAPELGICVPKVNSLRKIFPYFDLPINLFDEHALGKAIEKDVRIWFNNENQSLRKNVKGSFENIYSLLKTNNLNFIEEKVSDVIAGENGWLFLTGGSNSVLDTYQSPNNSPWLEGWVRVLKSRDKEMACLDIKYLHISAPEKLSIYHRYSNIDNVCFSNSPSNLLDLKYNESNRCYINPTNYLKTQSFKRNVYHKTDSHWNFVGAYAAYQLIMAKLGLEQNSTILNKNRNFVELGLDLGSKFTPSILERVFFNKLPDNVTRVWANDLVTYKEENNLDNSIGLHVGSSIKYRNETPIHNHKIVIFGDSFSEYRPHYLTGILAETFKEVVFVWGLNIDYKLIKNIKPDIVLTECAERFMPSNIPDDNFDYRSRVKLAISNSINSRKKQKR